jgi:DNA-binding transcriptional ArsR family regulator
MTVEPASVARFAGLLADPTRMAMCLALIDGRAWTAGELARHVGVTASTASEHLTSLVAADVLAETRQGRHRYVRLAGPEVGQLIEDLAALAGVPVPAPRSLRAGRVAVEMAFARTCYDHLAGTLGVALRERLELLGYVETTKGVSLTADGETWLKGLAVDVELADARRPLIRICLDWTERRPHLGGLTGSVIREHLLAQGWITQRPRERAVRVTPAGEAGLYDELGLDVPALRG